MAEQISLHRFSGKLDTSVGFRGRKNAAFERHYRRPAKGRLLPLSMKKQIARMTALGNLSNVLYPAYELGMRKFAKRRQMSVNNLFVKESAPAITVDNSLHVTADYSKIIVAKGHLPQVLFAAADFSTPQTVKIVFGSAAGVEGASDDDKVYAVVFCPVAAGLVISRPVTRDAGSLVVTLPDDWNGLEVKVWGFAIGVQPLERNDGESSESTFLGSGTVN